MWVYVTESRSCKELTEREECVVICGMTEGVEWGGSDNARL